MCPTLHGFISHFITPCSDCAGGCCAASGSAFGPIAHLARQQRTETCLASVSVRISDFLKNKFSDSKTTAGSYMRC